ncbi:MAG: cysteine desulfurase [Rhodothermales bacterium]|nr:cysteine desulfurase [Rhodothermales bacterium]
MEQPIYLDYNATTPVDPVVLERMLPFFSTNFGNPSSKGHSYGWYAESAVQAAREKVAATLKCKPEEVTFTSGATEAINTVIKGVALGSKGKQIITTSTEHKAVLKTCDYLESQGYEITYLPVNELGLISIADLNDAITDETVLVALMWANNETGVIQPMAEVSKLTRDRGVPLFSDATQAVGKIDFDASLVDYLACSAHKFYGPKGIGAMYINSASRSIQPLIAGGGQEHGLRSGTLNVPAIVGMGEAAALIPDRLEADRERWLSMRQHFEDRLTQCDGVFVNGRECERLPQTANVAFPNVPQIKFGLKLRSLAVSAGSACQTGVGGPSHVLTAMGVEPKVAGSCIRFSFGRLTTIEDVDKACNIICGAYDELLAATQASV